MDERLITSELAQLHVEPNNEHSTAFTAASHTADDRKDGWGLETSLGYEEAGPAGLTVLQQLHVESSSEHS